MKTVLLVDDDPDMHRLVTAVLSKAQVPLRLEAVESGERALQRLKDGPVDLVLLDIGLPEGDGFSVFEALRDRQGGLPIIFLTSHEGVADKVRAFSLGAEDYIVKPFVAEEFRARVEARLRRTGGDSEGLIVRGGLRLHAPLQRASFRLEKPGGEGEERDLRLTSTEFKILYRLARDPDAIVTRTELARDIWGAGVHVVDHSLHTHIYTLRKKLAGTGCLVEFINRMGYRLKLDGADRETAI